MDITATATRWHGEGARVVTKRTYQTMRMFLMVFVVC